MTIRILVVDDHPIVRQGLKTLLEGHSGWQVVGEASDGAEAVDVRIAGPAPVAELDAELERALCLLDEFDLVEL